MAKYKVKEPSETNTAPPVRYSSAYRDLFEKPSVNIYSPSESNARAMAVSRIVNSLSIW